MCVCVCACACVCVCESPRTNEAKVGNIHFELHAKNDMKVIFWQFWGSCIF